MASGTPLWSHNWFARVDLQVEEVCGLPFDSIYTVVIPVIAFILLYGPSLGKSITQFWLSELNRQEVDESCWKNDLGTCNKRIIDCAETTEAFA